MRRQFDRLRSRDKESSLMRPSASLAASLALVGLLSGCGTIASSPFEGFGGFVADTHGLQANPNRPVSEGETVRRVLGQPAELEPLLPETGNVWPGPIEASASLGDIARANPDQILKPDGEITLPRTLRGNAANPLPPPPALVTPRPVPQASTTTAAPPAVMPALAPTPAPAPTPAAQTAPAPRFVQTPNGPATLSGGPGVLTYTDQKGNTGLVVPNGNGTSTLIAPDGSVQTVPTPK
jgi:hypothetical protein